MMLFDPVNNLTYDAQKLAEFNAKLRNISYLHDDDELNELLSIYGIDVDFSYHSGFEAKMLTFASMICTQAFVQFSCGYKLLLVKHKRCGKYSNTYSTSIGFPVDVPDFDEYYRSIVRYTKDLLYKTHKRFIQVESLVDSTNDDHTIEIKIYAASSPEELCLKLALAGSHHNTLACSEV